MTPFFGSPVGEWFVQWAGFGPCSWHLSLALQQVSGFCGWAGFVPCWWCLSLALQYVSGLHGELDLVTAHKACPLQSVSGLCGQPDLDPAHNVCPWLFSMWVTSIVHWIWTLLMVPVLGFPVCEWLLWWAGFGTCSRCLSLALQYVSGFCGGLNLDPADNTCTWLFRKWVASMVSWIWTLLTTPVLGSPGCEWLLWWAEFGPCSWHLYLALQDVGGFHGELYLDPAHKGCLWLSRMWVVSMMGYIWSLPMMPILGSPESEWLLSQAALNFLTNLFLTSGCAWLMCSTLCQIYWYKLFFSNPLSNNIAFWLLRWYVLSRYWFGNASNIMTR